MWLHLSLHYDTPWRPTFALLAPRPSEVGDMSSIPLALVDGALAPGCAHLPVFLTLWEALARVDLDAPVGLRAFKLVASDHLAVRVVEPWKVRVEALGPEVVPFWRGSELEKARRRRKGKGRGRGRGKGRGRGRARGRAGGAGAIEDDVADAEELEGFDAGAGADVDAMPLMAIEDAEDSEENDDDLATWLEEESDDLFEDLFAEPPDALIDHDVASEPGSEPTSSSSKTSDSDSSSSSSSSSSSGSSDSGEAKDALGKALSVPIPGTDRVGLTQMTEIGGRRELYATCPCRDTHGSCVKTRTVNPGPRRGQGRPLGLLCAWLRAATKPEHAGRPAHMAHTPTFADRRAARDFLKDIVDVERFSSLSAIRLQTQGPSQRRFAEVGARVLADIAPRGVGGRSGRLRQT